VVAQWLFSTVHNCACKVIEEQTLWGQTVCRVWLPNQDAVVRVPRSALRPLGVDLRPDIERHRIAYVAAAAKVAEVLDGGTGDSSGPVLLAPMEANVIPLPHQLYALSRAISGDRVRYLLADEVGLGKTIEAGLIMRELKQRGLVRRTLVVSPKGLATQWVAEMQSHFDERFQLVLGEDIGAMQRLTSGTGSAASPWAMFDQVIVSLDSVKPLDRRRGWSQARIAEFNRSRFEDLITAGWDLVVVKVDTHTDLRLPSQKVKAHAEDRPATLRATRRLQADPDLLRELALDQFVDRIAGSGLPGPRRRLAARGRESPAPRRASRLACRPPRTVSVREKPARRSSRHEPRVQRRRRPPARSARVRRAPTRATLCETVR